jgi:methyl-accepting chemotaxis protein
MSWFNDLTIRTKLILAFLATLSLTAWSGAFSIAQLGNVNATATEMKVNWVPSVRVTSDMNTSTSHFRIAELQHILSFDEDEKARYDKTLAEVLAAIRTHTAAYEKLISSPEERAMYEAYKRSWGIYMAEHRKVLELSRSQRTGEARDLLRGASQKAFEETSQQLMRLAALNVEGARAAGERGDQTYVSSRAWIVGIVAASLVAGMALAVFVAQAVAAPLVRAVQLARNVAAGDLSESIEVDRKDETGMLLQALKDMNGALAGMVTDVRGGAMSMAAASQQIAAGNADLSARTEGQASSLEETAASMEELTSTVKQNAENARQADQLARAASEVARKGGAAVAEVVGRMSAIDASARQVVDIISVIDGIAFQTNILALNAAVEAARAGEQGRGFAVVAGEVRNLAQRSATAAKEIKLLIDNSVEQTQAGTRLVDQAGATMGEVVDSIRRVTDIVGEISAASQEQTAGIEQVNQAVLQMDQMTQQNAALVEESAAASESLRQQATRLAQAVSVFKLADASGAPSAAPAARRSVPGQRSSSPLALAAAH